MPTTNYLTMNGVLMGETGPNGTMYYDTDPLGSVTMTTDENANVLNEYRYKPYGGLLSKTGTAPDPKFMWVGSQGYRSTGRSHAEYYVRARHFGRADGRWTTADPLWPLQPKYIYVSGVPISKTDPSGRFYEPPCIPKGALAPPTGGVSCTAGLVPTHRGIVLFVKAYRQVTFTIQTQCPPGSQGCIPDCSFHQKIDGTICVGKKKTYPANSPDDPAPPFEGWCPSPPANPCTNAYTMVDAPGLAYAIPPFELCPLALELGGYIYSPNDLPLEWNMNYHTWAECGDQKTNTVDWTVRFRIAMDSSGWPTCQTVEPIPFTCAK